MKSVTRNSDSKNKIIWAMDPTQNPKEAKDMIKELKIWAKRLRCKVQPVAICSKSTLNFPADLNISLKEGFEKLAQKSVVYYFKKIGTNDFLPAQVVFTRALSNRKMASELSKFAERTNALLVFVNTRAMKTWNPLRFGGFAETLVATSTVPVLLLNPSAKPSSQIPSILFPVDFNRESINALMRLKPWAKAFNSKVLLYNQVEKPTVYVPANNGYFPSTDLVFSMKTMEKSRNKKAQMLSDDLKKQQIDCEVVIQPQRKSVASDIVDVANKRHVKLIALASHSGPLSQTLLGSTARDVLLQAKCPVLIFHRPKGVRKHDRGPKQTSSKRNLNRKDHSSQTVVHHA